MDQIVQVILPNTLRLVNINPTEVGKQILTIYGVCTQITKCGYNPSVNINGV